MIADKQRRARIWNCDRGHTWAAVDTPRHCPYCIGGKPCDGAVK